MAEAFDVADFFRGDGYALFLLASEAADVQVVQQAASFAAYPDDDVLVDAHGADHRAVDASEDEGEQQYAGDDEDVEEGCASDDPEHRGQELQLGHPSEPVLSDSEEKERDTDEENGRERDSDFA